MFVAAIQNYEHAWMQPLRSQICTSFLLFDHWLQGSLLSD